MDSLEFDLKKVAHFYEQSEVFSHSRCGAGGAVPGMKNKDHSAVSVSEEHPLMLTDLLVWGARRQTGIQLRKQLPGNAGGG